MITEACTLAWNSACTDPSVERVLADRPATGTGALEQAVRCVRRTVASNQPLRLVACVDLGDRAALWLGDMGLPSRMFFLLAVTGAA